MIMKCTNCGGALTYNIISGDLKCKHCGSAFFIDEFEKDEQADSMLECNVFTCTTCAAQLMINDNEASTYCAYCGQPTIVFDRIDKMKRPKKIIPFSVTKEQAIASVRKRFKKGFFIPNEIKNFEVERMTGIYVPFWLYDIHYHDRQKLEGDHGKYTHTYYRDAETDFANVTVDASEKFSNYTSQQLEPYHMQALADFHTGYLSGFYADKYDQDAKSLSDLAVERCEKLFNAEIERSISADNIKLLESHPLTKMKKETYALLPAWFMTIRYKNEPYTILINGQTGKLTGAVPIVKKKVTAVFVTLLTILALFITPISVSAFNNLQYTSDPDESFLKYVVLAVFFCISCIGIGRSKLKAYKTHMEHTTSREMENFAQDRQKGE